MATTPRKLDPTGTTSLRLKFRQKIRARMAVVQQVILDAVVKEDVLGLLPVTLARVKPSDLGMSTPGWRAFEFRTDDEKLVGFASWAEEMSALGILSFQTAMGDSLLGAALSGRSHWSDLYIMTAFKKGLSDGVRDYRRAQMGVGIKTGLPFGASADTFVAGQLLLPVNADKARLIYTRAYTELKGITAEMDRGISRALAGVIARGGDPAQASREIRKVVQLAKNRADILARTEIIRAHAEAKLNMFEQLGAIGVSVLAEWSTAGDDRVCPLCEPLEGKIYTMQEARGLIPRHPNCRCTWIPYVPPLKEK